MAAILQATIGLMGLLLLAVAGVALWLRPRIADGRIADGMGSPYPDAVQGFEADQESESGLNPDPALEAGPWNGVTTWIEADKAPGVREAPIEAVRQIESEPTQ